MNKLIYPCTDLAIDVGDNGISKKIYMELLNDFFSNFGFNITLGGDIYGFPHTFDLIDYANKKGVKSIGVYVDHLTDDSAKKLRKRNIRAIMFPLQSVQPQINNKILGKGSFKKTINGIRVAQKYGIKTEIITVVDSNAFKTIPKMINLMKKETVDLLIIGRSIMTKYFGLKLSEFPYSEYHKLLEYLVKEDAQLKKEGTGKLSLMSCPHKILINDTLASIDVGGGCSAGLLSCYVSPEVTIHPCPALFDLVVGDLKTSSFKDIWEHSEILKGFRTRDQLEGKCKGCKYKMKCGGCRADAYRVNGDLWSEDPGCWL